MNILEVLPIAFLNCATDFNISMCNASIYNETNIEVVGKNTGSNTCEYFFKNKSHCRN